MIIRSARPQQNFTVLDNQVLRNTKLTWKARGLLAYLLSQPDDWRTTLASLAAVSPEGIHSVRTGMKELEEHGYIIRVRTQDARGLWQTHTIVRDHPVDKPGDKWLTYPQPKSGFPHFGEPERITKN